MRVVQIGSNKGNDDLAKFLKQNFENLDRGIFVEANPNHINNLRQCYSQYSNACVENLAIKLPQHPGNQITLYINLDVREDHHEEATTVREQIQGNNVASINVPCLSLDEFFQRHNITELDWLLLDVEGLDVDILLSTDWRKYNIRRIDCESYHFGEKRDIIDKMFHDLGYTKVIGLQYYFDDAWVKSKEKVDDLITEYAITQCKKDLETDKENPRMLSTLSKYHNELPMFNHIHLKNPGVTTSVLPPHIFHEVLKEVKEIEQNDHGYLKMNNQLAGQIAREYQLQKSQAIINPFLEQMAAEYGKHFDYYPNHNFQVESLWVNYQKKTEYNPIHNHDGLLSFVCWVQIPYRLQDEYSVQHSQNSSLKAASTFQFVYSSILGNIINEKLEIDQDWAGRIVMFPSKLLHTVYPFFTSNDYRISIAGNIS